MLSHRITWCNASFLTLSYWCDASYFTFSILLAVQPSLFTLAGHYGTSAVAWWVSWRTPTGFFLVCGQFLWRHLFLGEVSTMVHSYWYGTSSAVRSHNQIWIPMVWEKTTSIDCKQRKTTYEIRWPWPVTTFWNPTLTSRWPWPVTTFWNPTLTSTLRRK